MSKYLKTAFLSLVTLFSISMAFTPLPVYADNGAAVCEGAGAVAGEDCADTSGQINDLVTLGIRILQVIAGVMAVVYIILGGLRYINSGGEASKVSSAKNAIIYACIGIAVVALSEVIVQFVLNRIDDTAPDAETSLVIKNV